MDDPLFFLRLKLEEAREGRNTDDAQKFSDLLERITRLETWHAFTEDYSSWPQRDVPVWITDGKHIAIGGRAKNGALLVRMYLERGMFPPEQATHWAEIQLPGAFPC